MTIAVAAAVYFGVNVLLKNEEVATFSSAMRRKLGKR